MEEKIMCGKVANNIVIFSNNYIEDNDLLISLDGKTIDKKTFDKLKKIYLTYNEEFVNEIDDYYSIYLFDKKIIS